MTRLVVGAGLVLILASQAYATDTYVATTGNNSNACGAGIDSPKLTIQNAIDNCAGAGNQVIVRNGTYTQRAVITTGGTNGNPFVLKAENKHLAILDGPVATGNQWGIEVGACNVTIDGFEIKEFAGLGGQGAGIWLGPCNSNDSTTEIKNNHVWGTTGVDNPSGIKIGSSTDNYRGTVNVYNNLVHDNDDVGSTGENWVGIIVFMDSLGAGQTLTLTIRNNEVYNEGWGIRWKHRAPAGTVSVIIEKNYIHDIVADGNQTGSCVGGEQRGLIVRYNICDTVGAANGKAAFYFGPDGTSAHSGENFELYNNCVYNVARGMFISSASNGTVHDNIFHTVTDGGQDMGLRLDTGQTVSGLSLTMNYNNYAGTAIGREVGENYGGTIRNLAFLQGMTPARETNGRSGATGWVSPPTDFTLSGGSSNIDAGTGGNDIGCYPIGTEVIGIDSGGSSTGGSMDVKQYSEPVTLTRR